MKYVGVGVIGYLVSVLILVPIHIQLGFYPGVAGLLAIAGAILAILIYKSRENSEPPKVITPSESVRNSQTRVGASSRNRASTIRAAGPNARIPASPVVGNPQSSPTTTSSVCPACSKDNPREAIHCMACGKMLPGMRCPKCQTENLPEAVFCMSCGERR